MLFIHVFLATGYNEVPFSNISLNGGSTTDDEITAPFPPPTYKVRAIHLEHNFIEGQPPKEKRKGNKNISTQKCNLAYRVEKETWLKGRFNVVPCSKPCR